MPIKGFGIGLENLCAVLFEIIELATVERPGEHAKDAEHQHGGHGNEEVEDVHSCHLDSRSEFITTKSELAAMPKPAAQGGSKPTSAKGTHAAL